jgi:hypothetical protein
MGPVLRLERSPAHKALRGYRTQRGHLVGHQPVLRSGPGHEQVDARSQAEQQAGLVAPAVTGIEPANGTGLDLPKRIRIGRLGGFSRAL